MRIPPDVMDNPYGALACFVIPRSYLEKNIKFFLLLKDETKPTAHSMPDEVCGFTDVLDESLRKILFSTGHEREVFSITYFPASSIYPSIKNTVSRIEISCHPFEGLAND